ncbi:MAG: COR domain-containing protein [Methylococcaceae bacterium]
MKLSREEIEARLESVPSDVRVAFAVRSAMRVLPLLAMQNKQNQDKDAFWFWQTDDSSRYLLAIFKAYSISIEFIFTGKYVAYAVNNTIDTVHLAAIDATNNAYTMASTPANAAVMASCMADVADTAAIAAQIAYAAYSAIHTAINTATAGNAAQAAYDAINSNAYVATASEAAIAATAANIDAVNTVCAAFYAAHNMTHNLIGQEIAFDLVLAGYATAIDLLQRPLWSNLIEHNYLQLYENFRNQLLSLNAGFEVWLSWYDDRLYGRDINSALLSQWNSIADEIESYNVLKVNTYLANLANKKATEALNRVRVIFIGYSEAGKTSLIRALFNEIILEDKTETTIGVAIREWSMPNSEIKASFWDFGGLTITHATYPYFFRASCLYVVVLHQHADINGTEQAEYWLDYIRSFAKSASVILVWNKSDQNFMDLNISYLKQKYPNIVSIHGLSCIRARSSFQLKFEAFKQEFCQQIQEINSHQILFTAEQFTALESLRYYLTKTTFLSRLQFEEICTDQGISSKGIQNSAWLLAILDNLGLVIHFPQLENLSNYVLNSQWLTHGIYTLLYNKQALLTEDAIVYLLSKDKVENEQGYLLNYPKIKCQVIMQAMKAFKLCYSSATQANSLIIPELLPSDQPHLPFDKHDALKFDFVFSSFLPQNLMSELIINHDFSIYEAIVWQQGVLLKNPNSATYALLQVNYHKRSLSIYVRGEEANDYLAHLHEHVLTLLSRMVIDYKEWIGLPKQACTGNTTLLRAEEKAAYRQLIATIKEGKGEFISELGLHYNVTRLLALLFSPDAQKKLGIHYADLANTHLKISSSLKIENSEP